MTIHGDYPTANAERLMGIDRELAEHLTGDHPLREPRLTELMEERRKLLAHFKQIRHCPTCGHPLAAAAKVARAPTT